MLTESAFYIAQDCEAGRRQVKYGQLAQSVEQRTENPRVPGSIPGLATTKNVLVL